MPGLAECDSSSSGRWVVRHQTAIGLYVAGCGAILPRHWRESRLSTAAVGFTGIFGDRAILGRRPRRGPDAAAALSLAGLAWHVER